jgi:hypothetical protein
MHVQGILKHLVDALAVLEPSMTNPMAHPVTSLVMALSVNNVCLRPSCASDMGFPSQSEPKYTVIGSLTLVQLAT